MRIVNPRVVLPALALFALACAPHRPCAPHHGEPWCGRGPAAAMPHGCGPDACAYGSRCYSGGAIRSNDGACQECSGGKWVSATGCTACGGKMGKTSGPCEHEHHHHPGR